MTDIDIIRNAIKTLDNINIPTWLLEQIGIPIYNVNKDLKRLYEAIMERMQQNQAQEQANVEEPQEEVAKAGAEENA